MGARARTLQQVAGPGGVTTARTHIIRLLVPALLAAVARPALAFHSGGVGECEGCHSMHNATGGVPVVGGGLGGYLLKGSDPTSVCLHCHEAGGARSPGVHIISTSSSDLGTGRAPVQLSPGGDFGWLRKTYSWTPAPAEATRVSPGERHGHNVVATDYGYLPDRKHSTAPGGTYPSGNLSCTGCHDPHGRYRRLAGDTMAATGAPIVDSGSYASSPEPVPGAWAVGVYRMLGGIGFRPASLPEGFAFTHGPPDAVAPNVYNRSEAVTQTRVAYGRGMSEWCANCHPRMLELGTTAAMGTLRHPVGNDARLPGGIQTNYTAYVKTGSIGNVDYTKAYLSLVPYEEGTGDYATLKQHARSDDTYLNGPDTRSNVSCLSCHRAHASGFDSILRYGVGNTFVTVSDPAGNPIWPDPATAPAEAQGRTAAETQQAYYGRNASTFAAYQASLCNKCHVKD